MSLALTFPLVDATSDLGRIGQTYDLTQIWQVGDLRIRTAVHYDNHVDQAHYRAELWTDAGWTEVCHILGADPRGQAMPHGYRPDRVRVREGAERMASDLLDIALRTLGVQA